MIDDQHEQTNREGDVSVSSPSPGLAGECVAPSPDSSNGVGVVLPLASGLAGEVANPPPVRSDEHVPPVRGSDEPIALDTARSLLQRHSSLMRIPLSEVPKEFMSVRKYVKGLRNVLEDECVRRHGGVSTTRAAIINSISRVEQSIRMIEKLFRLEATTMKLPEKADLQERLCRLTEKRDKAIQSLDLDADPTKRRNVFATLDNGGGS